MNRAQMTAPFAEEELRQFEGRGGKVMTFIEDETVMDRLDAGYGYGNWQVQVEETRIEGVVKVRLGVRENGEWAWYEDFGYPNQKGGDELKEAVSDGIRRCGRYLGIARDLYRKRTYEQDAKPKRRRGQSDEQRPVGDYDEPPDRDELERTTHADGLIGVANLGKNGGASTGTDYNLRQEKDGAHVIGFRLTQGRKGYKVLAFDPLASVLATQNIIGERVTCWGTMHDESFRDDKTGRLITYQIMHLERIATADFVLPAAITDSPLPVSPLREPEEAPSEPLFDPIESARLDAEEEAMANA